MSCYAPNYLPQPPRLWSRVQNNCTYGYDNDNDNDNENIENNLVKMPYSNEIIPASLLAHKMAMLNKGNILQYKSNSSNLTKAQRYSKIAKGQWVNRNTTWATQNINGYTNPNTTSLKRTGNVVNLAIDPITGAILGPTLEPVTCATEPIPIYDGLPSNGGGGGSSTNDPNIPPPIEPGDGSNVSFPIVPETPIKPIVIQDGGNLICSIQENICTGETKHSVSQQLCYPTTASDVPGKIQDLCWNDGTPTWYPRQRYTMTNSTDKWPDNAKLLSANLNNEKLNEFIKYLKILDETTINKDDILLVFIEQLKYNTNLTIQNDLINNLEDMSTYNSYASTELIGNTFNKIEYLYNKFFNASSDEIVSNN